MLRIESPFAATSRALQWSVALVLVTAVPIQASSATLGYAPGFQVRQVDTAAIARTLNWAASQSPEEAPPKVWIYFTDKQVFDSDACARRLAEIRGALNDHAAFRRAKVMEEPLVDFLDIPVAEEYVESVRSAGATVLRRSRWLNALSVRASFETLAAIAEMPFVHKLAPVHRYRAEHLPLQRSTRPATVPKGARDLYDYGPSFGQLDEIGVVEAHNAGYSGAGVIIGMLDTGFKRDHPAFQQIIAEDRLLAQWDYVDDDGDTMDGPDDIPGTQDHGSATWSVVGGFFEGELIGPAYGAGYVLAKTEDVSDEYPAEEDNWVAAAEWCDELGVDVISSSLAYYTWYTPDDMDGDTAVITIGADIAVSRGIVVSTGAGNMGDQDWYIVTAPADGDSVIAVGAVDQDNLLAGFSSHGPTADGRKKPEVVARGLATVCACNYTHDPLGDEFATNSGTSLSCPLVSGCAALLIEAAPSWPPMAVREALMTTADNADNPDNDRGWGRVDVWAAIGLTVDAPVIDREAFDPRLRVAPNPSLSHTRFLLELPASIRREVVVRLEVFDVAGRKVWMKKINADTRFVDWDGESIDDKPVPPGLYLVRIDAGGWLATAKVLIR